MTGSLHGNTAALTARDPIVFKILLEAESRGLSLKQMEELSGISDSVISMIRHPRMHKNSMCGHQPKLYQIQALAGMVGMELKLVPMEKK